MGRSHTTRRRELLRQLGATGPVLKGSLAEVELTCGTPSCRCHKGGPKHKGWYFSYRAGGRSHTVYIPKGVVPEAQRAHANWLKLKTLLEELTVLHVEELREKARQAKRREKE